MVAINPAQVLITKKFDYELYNLDLNYNLQNVSLLSSTTYIDYRHQYPFSYIGGPATVYAGALEGNDARHIAAHMLAQEFRVASRDTGALKWTAGAFLHFSLYQAKADITRAAQVGFHCDDLAAAHARMVAGGAPVIHPPRPEPWGETARYSDPDGNVVSLTHG